MLPSEIQALLAKILFFVFATVMVCMMKARADLPPLKTSVQLTQTISSN